MATITLINISRLIGILGMCALIAGNFLPPDDSRLWCFVAGGLLLLIPPLVEFNLFFISLQLVALSGVAMGFLDVSWTIKMAIPILVFSLFMFYFYTRDAFDDRTIIIGCIGVGCLAIGYGIIRAEVYFLGGLLLTIYSWISFRQGVNIAILWAITNAVFCLAALYAILQDGNYL